jgi:multidrug efflux pump subunit AcrB
LPAGAAKFGDREYLVRINSSPRRVEELNNLPIRTVNGATVYMRDVAQVRDGNSVQTNTVRINGGRAALLTVLKNGGASTLDIVDSVRQQLKQIKLGMPAALYIDELFDQSNRRVSSLNRCWKSSVLYQANRGTLNAIGSPTTTIWISKP